jgi:hypothetical protein
MRVKAKRLGWNEKLTAEQEFDLEPYDHDNDDLEGELVQFTVPARNEHPEIKVCTVDGQEADPETIREL